MRFYNVVCLVPFFAAVSCAGTDDLSETYIPPKNTVPVTYTDAQLIETVQKDVLKYFWDFSESNSGLARERLVPDNPGKDASIISTGGSGFGLMTILVGIKNGFIPRAESVNRIIKALDFLQKADRFRGAWPHWIDGKSGKAVPFSALDNGGDLVETAFLAQSLICIREYFKTSSDDREKILALKADELWKGIEWNWYTQNQNVLYWHWSPGNEWQMNQKIQGYDETLVTYVLASASPTFPIQKSVYINGWARNGTIKNSESQYSISLVVTHNGISGNVGPMFWSQYSFLGLDPRGLSDEFVNYGDAVVNHAKIQYQYALANPKGWRGYSSKNWGFTASYSRNSDGSTGYAAHSPVNDLGIISPTASLSNMPYTPAESMSVLRFIYNENYAKYVGAAGPFDAYSVHYNWIATRYLAVDQGTIAPMIENYKSAFLWNLFMNAPDVKLGLIKLGFHSSQYGF